MADENIEVDLRFKVSGNAADALNKMAHQTQQLNAEEKKYQDLLKKRVESIQQAQRLNDDLVRAGLRSDPYQRQAEMDLRTRQRHLWGTSGTRGIASAGALAHGNLTQAGISSALGTGTVGQIAGMIVEGVKTAARTGAEIANVQNHGLLSEQGKERGVGRALGMGWAIDFVDAITGVTERLRKIREQDLPIGEMALRGQSDIRRRTSEIAFQEAAAVARARGLGAYAQSGEIAAGARGFHRQTAESQRAYERYQVMRPLELASRRADIEAEAARRTAEFARRQSDQASGRSRAAQGRLGQYGRLLYRGDASYDYNFNTPSGNIADEGQFRARGALAALDAENKSREAIEKMTHAREAEARAAEAANRANEARTALLRGELQLLEARERRQAGWAQSIGAMNPLERSSARMAAQAIRSAGNLQAVTPEQQELAARYNPALIQRLREQAGERELMQSGELAREEGDNRSLRQLRERDIPAISSQIEVKTSFDEAALARALANSFAGMAERIAAEMRRSFETAITGLMNKLLLQNVNRQ